MEANQMREISVSEAMLKAIQNTLQNLTNLFNSDHLGIDQQMSICKRQVWEMKEMVRGIFDMERLLHPRAFSTAVEIGKQLKEVSEQISICEADVNEANVKALSLLYKQKNKLDAMYLRALDREDKQVDEINKMKDESDLIEKE
jgi:hypothetical protein